MCKEVGTNDQSTDLGAHLWAILISDFPQSITQGKTCTCYISLVKIFTIWNDEANFAEDVQVVFMEVIM